MKKVLLGLVFAGAFSALGESSDMPEMVLVAGGCFQMGSAAGEPDEKPVHKVCMDDFYMDKYEVTQGAYGKVMGGNPCSARRFMVQLCALSPHELPFRRSPR